MEQRNMAGSLQFNSIGTTKERKNFESEILRIRMIEKAQAKKSQVMATLKKMSLMASIGGVIAVSSIYGVKTGANKLMHQYQIEKEYNTLKDDAQNFINNNTHMILKDRDGEMVWEPQYNHYGIAQSIKNYEAIYGDVSASSLTAMVMTSINESEYQNMDKIVQFLVDNKDIKNVDDYIHSLGYETFDDYQDAMKEAYFEENQKEEVRAKYFSEGGKSR